jgi:integrase
VAANIQQRSGKFQLRIKHELLKKPFFGTFPTLSQAESWRDTALGWLARGLVPSEMISKPRGVHDPMLSAVIGDYQRQTSVTDSDDELLGVIKVEVSSVRVSDVTFTWAEDYVRSLKSEEKHLTPGTIRKRVGSLGRVLDWHFKRVAEPGEEPRANPLRNMSRGYSVYSKFDSELVEAKFDKNRDRRLSPEEAERVAQVLAGVKRQDRQRVFTKDPEFALFYQVLLCTGMRSFEVYRMRIEKIDFSINVIHVDGSKGHRGEIKPRDVPIRKELRDPLRGFCAGRTSGLVFSYWDGSADTRDIVSGRLTQRFLSLFEYAQVPDFSQHDLRHEATCRWYELRNEKGSWALETIHIAKIMGWSSFDLALRYASLRGEDLAALLD